MNYELMLIIKPLLPEDIKSKVLTKIEKLVKEVGGKIEKTDIWGKRHLAYNIRSHDEGYYVLMNLVMKPEKAKEFEKDLKIESDVLRYLFIREDNL